MYDLTLDGPGKNALSTAMMTSIQRRLDEAAGRPVLLTGTGDSFCAGLDLREISALDAVAMEGFLRQLEAMISQLYTYPAPLVAAVNGHAIAGGCILCLCADYRVVTTSPRARVGLNEVALGLRFPPRILSIVQARVPKEHLDVVLLGASLVDTTTALRWGLCDELSDDPITVARTKLDALWKHPIEAYAATKRDLRHDTVQLSAETERRFLSDALPMWTSDALRQRIAVVLKK